MSKKLKESKPEGLVIVLLIAPYSLNRDNRKATMLSQGVIRVMAFLGSVAAQVLASVLFELIKREWPM